MNQIYKDVYNLVAKIPSGKVTTYGRIAKKLGISSPRLVGRILHNNPDVELCPCHRVVFSDGKLAPGFAFGGPDAQRKLLEDEGVAFAGEKVDLGVSLFNVD